jgi:hypothetical protein
MRARKNHIAVVFSILSTINVVIFLCRDRFNFHKHGTYSSLYSPDTTKWKKFIFDYPQYELLDAKKIADSLHFSGQPTSAKVLEIGKFLYKRFNKQLGKSSDKLVSATPLTQYKILRSSDTVQLWCGNFAEMFAFFCWSEGIASRVIEVINPGDHHVLNECYLPETREWAVTDVTNDHLLIRKTNTARYANLLDVRDSPGLGLQAVDSSNVARPFDGTFYKKYFRNKNSIYYYYRTNNSAVYSPSEKIKRYFLPYTWYEEVTEDSTRNLTFYIKQFFILLWLIYAVLFFGKLVSFKAK